MSDAFDLDALDREGQEFAFVHDGATYTLPPDVPQAAVKAFDEGDAYGALEVLLGPDQWASVVASPKMLGVIKAGALIEAYTKHLGMDDVGGSSASTAN